MKPASFLWLILAVVTVAFSAYGLIVMKIAFWRVGHG